MKRFLWTGGMAIAGLLLGLKGQDTRSDVWWTALIVLWFACIGYGLGSIFDQKSPTRWLLVYWAVTLALVAPFFALPIGAAMLPDLFNVPRQQVGAGVLGALVGGFLGLVAGTIHSRRLRRSSRASRSGAIA
jgi:hypothetical protein